MRIGCHARDSWGAFGIVAIVLWGCSGTDDNGSGGTSGRTGNGGHGADVQTGGKATGGSAGNVTGGKGGGTTGGGSAVGGSGGTPSGGSGGSSMGGSAGLGGATGGAGGTGMGGSGGGSNTGGSGGVIPPLDCGKQAIVLENAGPPKNRVNYIIVGDGYTEAEQATTYTEHLQKAMTARFSPKGEPYTRYRKFVNICALKVASPKSGIPGVFEGSGNDTTRLGFVNGTKVKAAHKQYLPPDVDVDWSAAVLNNDRWWNSGGSPMVWSGGHPTKSAALHEGGHTFHNLDDEYDYGGGDRYTGPELSTVNTTIDPGGKKWERWKGFDQPGLGLIGAYEGGHYVPKGVFRPTKNSEMNQLPDYFNAPSIEKMIQDIYKIVSPVDSWTDNKVPLKGSVLLRVDVVDPAVVKLDWSVDGKVVQTNGGATFTPGGLTPGDHKVAARAYDDTPWVRNDRSRLEKTIEWTVTVTE